MARFTGKGVVITGATGDIGVATARAFAAGGADLGLVYHGRLQVAEGLARELEAAGSRVVLASVDLETSNDVEAGVRAAAHALESGLGRVDALVALAGLRATRELWQKPFPAVGAGDLHRAFAVDTVGTFLFAQALASSLVRVRGAIVVTSSTAAFDGDRVGIAFAVAKAANAGLVRVLARVLAPDVRVNGVAPGSVESEWLETLTPEQRTVLGGAPLAGRFARPEEIARAILDLAEPGFVNGQILRLDGGLFPP